MDTNNKPVIYGRVAVNTETTKTIEEFNAAIDQEIVWMRRDMTRWFEKYLKNDQDWLRQVAVLHANDL